MSLPFEDKTFFESAPLYLEIGSGKGDFIVSLAERHPENHYLAVERDVSSLGTLAKKIVEKELTNVKIVYQDFDKVAPELPKEGFKTIYLNFSSPYPKNQYENRRLTNKRFLSLYKEWLTEDGVIRQKTDNRAFFEYSVVSMSQNGLYFEKISCDLHKDDTIPNLTSEYEDRFAPLGPIYYVAAKYKKENI